jgi:hypothetical protein
MALKKNTNNGMYVVRLVMTMGILAVLAGVLIRLKNK